MEILHAILVRFAGSVRSGRTHSNYTRYLCRSWTEGTGRIKG